MNKTTALLVAVIVVLGGSFAWYATNHPPRGGEESLAGADGRELAPRTLHADIPATGLKKVAFRVGVGEVHVKPSGDEQVHLTVTIRQKENQLFGFVHWRARGDAQALASAAISQQVQDGTLDLALTYPDRTQDSDFKLDWELQVPVRLALDADMKVGEMTIVGPAAGVDARLNVGELSIDVPKGHLSATVNVGEIRATSGSTAHGHIVLSSNIGEAVLTLTGESAGSHEHGGLGNQVSLDGSGPDDMHLSINVGEASLHVDGGAAKP
jgi:hypothetical protein